jgi:hypothetical protein
MNNRFIRRISQALSGSIVRRPAWAALTAPLLLCGMICWLFLQQAAPEPAYAWPGGDLTLAWSSNEVERGRCLAWGDWDGDGDLDLAIGNAVPNLLLYQNSGGSLSLVWSSTGPYYITSLAWGDWDGDGDLDLAAGNLVDEQSFIFQNSVNMVFENTGGNLSLAWSSRITDINTTSVAWGDWDDDGDLDLVTGSTFPGNSPVAESIRVYRNDTIHTSEVPDPITDTNRLALAWTSNLSRDTRSVAWGDWDGDGDLDLAAGNYGEPNQVYRNETIHDPGVPDPITDTNRLALSGWSPASNATTSVAWGNWNDDDYLDLAVGNYGEPNQAYINTGNSLVTTPTWSSIEADHSTSVAWGDWDSDGDLDLAAGNGCLNDPCGSIHEPNRVYTNTGNSLVPTATWSSNE